MNNEPKKSFVAFLDILGFKEYILNTDPNKVKQIVKDVVSVSMMSGIAYASTSRHNELYPNDEKLGYFKTIKTPSGNIAQPNLDVSNLNSILIFDSIVIWTNADEAEDIIELIRAIQFVLRSQSAIGLPIRGAIAYGEIYFEDHHIVSNSTAKQTILISPAQVEAMKLEKQQQWSGCVLDDSVIERCEELDLNLDRNENIGTLKYRVPMKDKSEEKERVALTWIGSISGHTNGVPTTVENYIQESFAQHGKNVSEPSTIEKIKNTVDFINYYVKVFGQKKQGSSVTLA